MTKHGDGRLAGGQEMLRQQIGDGAIRGTFLPQFNDDIFGRDQILKFLRAKRRKFGNRFANGTGIKRVHNMGWLEFAFGSRPGHAVGWALRCRELFVAG